LDLCHKRLRLAQRCGKLGLCHLRILACRGDDAAECGVSLRMNCFAHSHTRTVRMTRKLTFATKYPKMGYRAGDGGHNGARAVQGSAQRCEEGTSGVSAGGASRR